MISGFIDLHNHSMWSDGDCKPEELIELAIETKLSAIAITDHYNTGKCASIRPEKLENYIETINSLKIRYAGKIKVLCGIEAHLDRIDENGGLEVFKNFDYGLSSRLDFVLLEYINGFPAGAKVAAIKDCVRRLKCRTGLAHSDLAMRRPLNPALEPIDNIITLMKRHNIFWEFNHGSKNKEGRKNNYMFDTFDNYLNHGNFPGIDFFSPD
ncbi:MAG TPA: PHP domain-containing protein [Candidatus Wallbacteria bacterium]|nr:PHP domain-containing protein [Candidatus Wallbacteria bacterium]